MPEERLTSDLSGGRKRRNRLWAVRSVQGSGDVVRRERVTLQQYHLKRRIADEPATHLHKPGLPGRGQAQAGW